MTWIRTTIGATALVACALSPLQASATLLRSPDGTTVYDTVNNVSWLADANLAATNRFGLAVCNGFTADTKTCVNASGSMSYQAAVAWVNAMNAAGYLGHTNWQLPTTPLTDSGCSFTGPQSNSFGWNCAGSALGSLYYNALGLTAPNTAVPIPNNTVGPFSNFQPYLYWSQSNDVQNGTGYYTFSFNSGFKGSNTEPNFVYALPMIAGKIPGTPPITGSGLQVNPGGQTVYDPVTNVTWSANANLAATDTFGLPACTAPGHPKLCVNQDGAMNWDSASQFVTNMNMGAGYLGQTSWELPPIDPNCNGYNCGENGSPMGELFYSQLGLSQGMPVVAAPKTAVGPFNNIQPYLYWACQGATIQDACQTDGPAPNFEWSFSFGNGFEGTDLQQNDLYVTAYFVGPPTSVASPTETPTSTSSPSSSPTTAPTRTPTATGTVPLPPLPTRTWTPSRAVNSTATRPPSASPSAPTATPETSGTPTETVTPSLCIGDCNHDGQVTVNEILTMVNIALGNTPVMACDAGDANHDGLITIDEILAAVNDALKGCAPQKSILSISVCTAGSGAPGSCPSGSSDTAQIVLAPDGSGKAINSYKGMIGISDEHQSIFSPRTLQGNSDYLFFVATRVQGGAPSTGVVVLSGGAGPDKNRQWTMDFADGYDSYSSGFGTIFVAPTGPNCPTVADGNPTHQDQTFDLKYAAPGSIVIDPTSAPGNLLMVYEGTNTCLGNSGGPDTGKFYSSVGVATSVDYGHSWPTYRGKSGFDFIPLPAENSSQGPQAPAGVLGSSVCVGNDCATTPPANYGRYAVLTPSVSIAAAAATGKPLPSSMGDSEMSAFLDDIDASPAPYVYVIYDFKAGTGAVADPKAPANDLMIARAQLSGGAAPLNFLKWNGQAFAGPGLGGYDSPVFPFGPFENCEGAAQLRYGGSISYVEDTRQYLLTFVCDSPGDPANGQVPGSPRGGAWFYSTSYDLSDPTRWTPPREIAGSWGAFDQSGGCSYYKGFYPTLMSLDKQPGHLGTSGYVFYLWGCQTEATPPPGRQYSSRAFTITTSQ